MFLNWPWMHIVILTFLYRNWSETQSMWSTFLIIFLINGEEFQNASPLLPDWDFFYNRELATNMSPVKFKNSATSPITTPISSLSSQRYSKSRILHLFKLNVSIISAIKFTVIGAALEMLSPINCVDPSSTVNMLQVSWIKPMYHLTTLAVSVKISFHFSRLLNYMANGSL